jgi:hypothetical protein
VIAQPFLVLGKSYERFAPTNRDANRDSESTDAEGGLEVEVQTPLACVPPAFDIPGSVHPPLPRRTPANRIDRPKTVSHGAAECFTVRYLGRVNRVGISSTIVGSARVPPATIQIRREHRDLLGDLVGWTVRSLDEPAQLTPVASRTLAHSPAVVFCCRRTRGWREWCGARQVPSHQSPCCWMPIARPESRTQISTKPQTVWRASAKMPWTTKRALHDRSRL